MPVRTSINLSDLTNAANQPNILGADHAPSPIKASNLAATHMSAAGFDDFPEHFRCGIDGKLMQNPVSFTSPTTGMVYRYELATLQAWAGTQGDVCPVSGEAFQPDSVVMDVGLRTEMEQFFAAKNRRGAQQGA